MKYIYFSQKYWVLNPFRGLSVSDGWDTQKKKEEISPSIICKKLPLLF